MAQVFKLAANVLNSIDNAAKETLEAGEDHESASTLRSKLRKGAGIAALGASSGGSSGSLAASDGPHISPVSADGSEGDDNAEEVLPAVAQEVRIL